MPRPKGSPNKTTKEMRDFVRAFLSDNLETMQRDFDSLEPLERLRFIEKLMPYVMPRYNAVAVEVAPSSRNLPEWMLNDRATVVLPDGQSITI
jgi:dihydrodipicolinate synthase/N-acetylneuraminate lyase